jgi:hypothetical protein
MKKKETERSPLNHNNGKDLEAEQPQEAYIPPKICYVLAIGSCCAIWVAVGLTGLSIYYSEEEI